MINNINELIFDQVFFDRRILEVEEILFEGKWLLKLLNEKGSESNISELLTEIEIKKNNSKKIKKLTYKCL